MTDPLRILHVDGNPFDRAIALGVLSHEPAGAHSPQGADEQGRRDAHRFLRLRRGRGAATPSGAPADRRPSSVPGARMPCVDPVVNPMPIPSVNRRARVSGGVPRAF